MAKNKLDFQAQLSRHGHDLSAGFTASIAPGMIIPQWFDIANPGDTYYLQSAMKARLQNIIRAFYGEIDLHLDYFFVPLQMLYTPFGQIFAQTNDFVSSTFDPAAFASTDSFPLLSIEDSIQEYSLTYQFLGHGEVWGKECARLIDALDGNPYVVCKFNVPSGVTTISADLCDMGKVSPWLFAAYQAIYQKYFRNDDLEKLSISSYNFDNSYQDADFYDGNMIKLRYCQRPSDYFTSLRVSPISSGVNKFKDIVGESSNTGGSLDDALLKVNSFLVTGGSNYPFESKFRRLDGPLSSSTNGAFNSVDINAREEKPAVPTFTGISASNIRALFAVDKFARIYGRADKTYDDQILAHFGIKIPHDVKHDITHIKHYHAVLGSQPVYGTANIPMFDGQSQNDIISTIGEVGGQGEVTLHASDEKFTAPVHGVIMAVAYCVTKPRYNNTFSKLHWLTNRLAFPIPEFDKLGAQPLFSAEANPWYLGGSAANISSPRIGWQNRYQQFKKKYDRVSFTYNGEPYSTLTANINIFSPWVISRSPFMKLGLYETNMQIIPAHYLFEDAHALDCIMATPFSGNWSDSYYSKPHLMFQSDPLLTEFYMRCKKVSWMSETGEPDL